MPAVASRLSQDYTNLSTRMAQYPRSDFAISIVTFHEQILGTHTYVNRARNSNELAKGYEIDISRN
jgi:tRNA(fMet)-specific endonuclease VapC